MTDPVLVNLDRAWPVVLAAAARVVLQPVFGTQYLSVARWLRSFSQWDDHQRTAWQQQHLARVLDHASTHVPFYRGCSSDPSKLTSFPIVDKAMLRENTELFSSSPRRGRTITKRTGGSTGDPWIYELDRSAFAHMYGAQLAAFEREGYRYGRRRLYLGAPASLGLDKVSRVKAVRLRLERNDPTLTSFDVSRPQSLVRAVRAVDRSASMWYGYVGTITAMAEAVIDEKLPLTGPPLIVTMAEKLEPSAREVVELAFSESTIVEEYGCNDGGVLAHSCPHGLLHVAASLSIVEVLDDGRPCRPGEEGEVTVTNLHARSMPFIRYRVGDRAVVGPQRCGCGRPGPTIDQITGRIGDKVTLSDGKVLVPSAFGKIFATTRNVRRWQVLQWSPGLIELRLDVGSAFDDHQRSILTRDVEHLVGEVATVELTTSRPLVQTNGGKHRVIVGQESLSDLHSPSNTTGRQPV